MLREGEAHDGQEEGVEDEMPGTSSSAGTAFGRAFARILSKSGGDDAAGAKAPILAKSSKVQKRQQEEREERAQVAERKKQKHEINKAQKQQQQAGADASKEAAKIAKQVFIKEIKGVRQTDDAEQMVPSESQKQAMPQGNGNNPSADDVTWDVLKENFSVGKQKLKDWDRMPEADVGNEDLGTAADVSSSDDDEEDEGDDGEGANSGSDEDGVDGEGGDPDANESDQDLEHW
eukprot:jgi/Chlat1/4424/Chrsp29S04562